MNELRYGRQCPNCGAVLADQYTRDEPQVMNHEPGSLRCFDNYELHVLVDYWIGTYWHIRHLLPMFGIGRSDECERIYCYNRIQQASELLGPEKVRKMMKITRIWYELNYPDADTAYKKLVPDEDTPSPLGPVDLN